MPRKVEAEAHSLLLNRRLNGEWFNIGPLEAETTVLNAIAVVDNEKASAELAAALAFDTAYFEAEMEDLRYYTQLELPQFPTALGTKPPRLYEVPIEPVSSDSFRIGFARSTRKISTARQVEWMNASGINTLDIWHDGIRSDTIESCLEELKEGERCFLFSKDILTPEEMRFALKMAREARAILQIGREKISFLSSSEASDESERMGPR